MENSELPLCGPSLLSCLGLLGYCEKALQQEYLASAKSDEHA